MPKIARKEGHDSAAENGADKVTKLAQSTAQQGAEAAREGSERARISATKAAENELQAVQQSAGESAEIGRSIVDLLGEQTRHNIEVATAFRRAANWDEVGEMQRAYLADSFNRMNQLGDRYRELMEAGMKSMALPIRR